jgi:hypothetical protein
MGVILRRISLIPLGYGGVVLFMGLSSNHRLCGWYMIAKKRTNVDV